MNKFELHFWKLAGLTDENKKSTQTGELVFGLKY